MQYAVPWSQVAWSEMAKVELVAEKVPFDVPPEASVRVEPAPKRRARARRAKTSE